MSQSKNIYPEFSGAVQQKSTVYIRKPNEVATVKNVDFATKLGAMRRRLGAQGSAASLPVLPVTTPPLGAYIARFPGARELWAVQNNAATSPTSSILQRWTGLAWSNIQTGMQPSVEANITDDLDEIWCSFYDTTTDTIYPPFTVDAAHTVSTTRQLNFAPQGRYYTEFAGAMWTFDVLANGTRYRNRAYKSSGPTGVISFARSAQTDVPITFNLVNQIPIMSSNTTPVGTVAVSSYYTPDPTRNGFSAFDGNISGSEWATASGTTTGTISYDFGSGITKVITHYSLAGVPSSDFTAARGPKTWTFDGSNNGSTWTTIDTQTSVAVWAADEKRTYTTANTTAYRYYRLNITSNQGDATFLVVAEFQLLNSSNNVNLLQLAVDSARYLKPGQLIDVYTAATETKIYDITITGVDKANDIITFLPYSQIFGTGGVNTTTDVITVGDASKMVTGTPIKFTTTGGLPAGLSAGVTYYAITGSSTTFKVATTTLNATLGVAVDITTTGSGNHTVQLSYIIGNKDELWAHGRKGMLTRFWNTDYRNPEASDWIKIPPTQDALDQITAVGKLSGRMFMFTPHSMTRYDGQQTLQLRDDIGCIAHKSISYYDSYMVWLDASGNIWARNEEAGTMDVISEAISDTLALVPLSQLPQATSVCIDGVYKLYLGVIGTKSLRVVYNFKTNQWSIEWFTPRMPLQFEYTYSGLVHPHFFDEKGQLWVDEQGNDDDGAVIPFEAELGDDNFGYEELKAYYGIKVYAKAVAACKVMVSLDGGQFIDQGQLTKPIQAIRFKNMVNATTINVKFVDSSSKAPVEVDRATVYYDLEEDTFVPTK